MGKIIITILVVALVAGVITETVLRKVVAERFQSSARELLLLSADHEVDVQLQGYLTQQYLTGGFKNVQVTIPEVPLKDGMRATLFATAERVPVDPEKDALTNMVAGVTFNGEQLSNVLQVFSYGIGQEAEIVGDSLEVKTFINFLGQKLPIKISFTPSVNDGKLHIDPKSVDAGMVNLSIDQLPDFAPLQKFANGMDICVAKYIPVGMTLSEIELSTANTLTVKLKADDNIAIDESLQKLGTC